MLTEATWANLLIGAVSFLSLVLLFLAFQAWRYARGTRTFILFVAFGLFFAKCLVLLAGLFLLPDWRVLLLASVGFDFTILVGFYFASLR